MNMFLILEKVIIGGISYKDQTMIDHPKLNIKLALFKRNTKIILVFSYNLFKVSQLKCALFLRQDLYRIQNSNEEVII